jgi:hypothetical protein
MLMDKSEEKMFTQSERIEKQELEIAHLKEENLTRKTELLALQVHRTRIFDLKNRKYIESSLTIISNFRTI